MTNEERDAAILSLGGRMAMLETLNANFLAHMVIQFDQPVALAAHIMDATETQLLRGRDVAEGDARVAADVALVSFQNLSEAMMAMLTRIAAPGGNG